MYKTPTCLSSTVELVLHRMHSWFYLTVASPSIANTSLHALLNLGIKKSLPGANLAVLTYSFSPLDATIWAESTSTIMLRRYLDLKHHQNYKMSHTVKKSSFFSKRRHPSIFLWVGQSIISYLVITVISTSTCNIFVLILHWNVFLQHVIVPQFYI